MSADKQEEQSADASLGAKMWVQTARSLKTLFDLIPEGRRDEVMSLLPELHESDALRSVQAEHAIYRIIDGEPADEPEQPEQTPPGDWKDITDWVQRVKENGRQKFSKVWELRGTLFYIRVYLARNSSDSWVEIGQDPYFRHISTPAGKNVNDTKWQSMFQLQSILHQAAGEIGQLLDSADEDI